MPILIPSTVLLPLTALALLLLLKPAWPVLHRTARPLFAPAVRGLLIVALALSSGLFRPTPAAAATSTVPKYAYMVASGPNSYDLMLWDGAKDKRLVTTAVPLGTGVSDAVARLSPDGTRVAYRITGDRNNGSSLRLYTIATRTALTITYSKTPDLGIGAFAWSPDSKSLAFTWTTPANSTDPDTGYGSIWVVGRQRQEPA